MGKDESRLAKGVAKLLNALTGSAYETPVALSAAPAAMARASGGDAYLDAIWEVARHGLLLATRSPSMMRSMSGAPDMSAENALPIARMLDSELMAIIQELDGIDYTAEGWMEDAEDAAAASTEPFASRSMEKNARWYPRAGMHGPIRNGRTTTMRGLSWAYARATSTSTANSDI